eukprot:1148221-Pelagomonas_calceolata.AAC.1
MDSMHQRQTQGLRERAQLRAGAVQPSLPLLHKGQVQSIGAYGGQESSTSNKKGTTKHTVAVCWNTFVPMHSQVLNARACAPPPLHTITSSVRCNMSMYPTNSIRSPGRLYSTCPALSKPWSAAAMGT